MLLIDTDVAVDLLREYPPALAWLDSLGDTELLLPGFVAMELIQGCRNKMEQDKLESQLGGYPVVWPSPAVCGEALSAFTQYHLSHGIGILDAPIGQMCASLDLPLCTFNQKHYAALPALRTLQPYPRSSS